MRSLFALNRARQSLPRVVSSCKHDKRVRACSSTDNASSCNSGKSLSLHHRVVYISKGCCWVVKCCATMMGLSWCPTHWYIYPSKVVVCMRQTHKAKNVMRKCANTLCIESRNNWMRDTPHISIHTVNPSPTQFKCASDTLVCSRIFARRRNYTERCSYLYKYGNHVRFLSN